MVERRVCPGRSVGSFLCVHSGAGLWFSLEVRQPLPPIPPFLLTVTTHRMEMEVCTSRTSGSSAVTEYAAYGLGRGMHRGDGMKTSRRISVSFDFDEGDWSTWLR
jgi:hypothetical protein